MNKLPPLSNEIKKQLFQVTQDGIEYLTTQVDNLQKHLTPAKKLYDHLLKKLPLNDNSSSQVNKLIRLGEYRILLGFLMLDILTSFRIYLNAKYKY